MVLGAASTSHRQTEGLSGVRQKLLLFPLGCCRLSSVCPVSCAAGAVPGPGGAALGHGGAGPQLCLLPCPVPLGPGPSKRAPAQVLPVPSRRPLVTGALCQHRGCARAAAHERRDGAGRAHPALAALCRGGAGPWLVKKGPIDGWHRAVIQHACSRAKPPRSWLPGTWGEPRALLPAVCFLRPVLAGSCCQRAGSCRQLLRDSPAPPPAHGTARCRAGEQLNSRMALKWGAGPGRPAAASVRGIWVHSCHSLAGTSGSAWRYGGK